MKAPPLQSNRLRKGLSLCLFISAFLPFAAHALEQPLEQDLESSYFFELGDASGTSYPKTFKFSLVKPYDGQDTIDAIFAPDGWIIERENLHDYDFRKEAYKKVLWDMLTDRELSHASFLQTASEYLGAGTDAYAKSLLIADSVRTTGDVAVEIAKVADFKHVDQLQEAAEKIGNARNSQVFKNLGTAMTVIEGARVIHHVGATMAFYEAVNYHDALSRLDYLESADLIKSGQLEPVYRDQAWQAAIDEVRDDLLALSSEQGFRSFVLSFDDNVSEIIQYGASIAYQAALLALKGHFAGFGNPMWASVPISWNYFFSQSAEYVDGMHYSVVAATIYERLGAHNRSAPTELGYNLQMAAQYLVYGYLDEVLDNSGMFQSWIFKPTINISESSLRISYEVKRQLSRDDLQALVAPINLLLQQSQGGVLATWNRYVPAESYILERSPDGSFGSSVTVASTEALSAVDEGLETGVYYYRLTPIVGGVQGEVIASSSFLVTDEATNPNYLELHYRFNGNPDAGGVYVIPMPSQEGSSSSHSFSFPTTGLEEGVHSLSLKLKDQESGLFSHYWWRIFAILDNSAAPSYDQIDYAIFSEGELARAGSLSVDPSAGSLSISLPTDDLGPGVYQLMLSARNAADTKRVAFKWNRIFAVLPPAPNTDNLELRYTVTKDGVALTTGAIPVPDGTVGRFEIPVASALTHLNTSYEAHLVLANNVGNESHSASFSFTLGPLDYESWLSNYFTEGEISGGDVVAMDADPDSDGLSNAEENAHGTNPLSADTDGDLIPDAVEVALNFNPLDNGERSLAESILDTASNSGGEISVATPDIWVENQRVKLSLQLWKSSNLESWLPLGAPIEIDEPIDEDAAVFFRMSAEGN